MRILHKLTGKVFIGLLIGLFYIRLFDNFCLAQSVDSAKVIEIAIIDFLYVSEGFRTAKQLERDVLIPGIDRGLNIVRAHDYKFNVKRVMKGSLNYFVYREAQKKASVTTYDLAIWGHVTPYETLGSYDLQMLIFTNSLKFEQCLFYYEMEIRDGRIRRWNNKLCDIPESGIALIPAVLCYKLIAFLDKNSQSKSFEQSYLEENIKRQLIPLVNSMPTTETVSWHPQQNCDADKLLGAVEFEIEEGDRLTLPLHESLYKSLGENLSKKVTYNWPIDDNRMLLATKNYSKWVLIGAGAIGAGAAVLLTGGDGGAAPPRGRVSIKIDQIQK